MDYLVGKFSSQIKDKCNKIPTNSEESAFWSVLIASERAKISEIVPTNYHK